MNKVCVYLSVLIAISSCSTGSKFERSDIYSLKSGGTSVDQLISKFGEPMSEVSGTNDGNFYSPKCGERGAPIELFVYMGSEMTGVMSERMESVNISVNEEGFVCHANKDTFRGGLGF